MRRGLLGALLMLSAVGLAQAQSPPLTGYIVRQQGGGLGVFVDKTITFSKTGGSAPHWIALGEERNERMGKPEIVRRWIDGRTCPALEGVLRNAAKLPAPRFAGPDEVTLTGWVSDTPTVSLTGMPQPSDGYQQTITRKELTGPVTDWWRASEAALAPCWKTGGPG